MNVVQAMLVQQVLVDCYDPGGPLRAWMVATSLVLENYVQNYNTARHPTKLIFQQKFVISIAGLKDYFILSRHDSAGIGWTRWCRWRARCKLQKMTSYDAPAELRARQFVDAAAPDRLDFTC
jgi:hypothetical protein